MARNFRTLLGCALLLGTATALHALDPLSFQEISLLLRTGESPQAIAQEANRRKVLQALTPDEIGKLRALGASDSLLDYLRSPALLASPEEAAAYQARRKSIATAPRPLPALSNPVPAPAPPPLPVSLPDPFKGGLEAAKTSAPRVLKYTDAFSLSQLPQARAQALAERKPLGFVMVWDSFFEKKPYNTRGTGSGSGMVHFYEAFKNSVVLVFVRHENELNQVPDAVKKGFFGPDEGGFAPNMCVVDATASEYIVEIPYGGAKSTGPLRDQIFQAKTEVIRQWLAQHPTATAAPAR